MSIAAIFRRAFAMSPLGDDAAHTLDFIPIAGSSDWREKKLAEAAARHGAAFKCAPDGLPREVIKNGASVTVGVKPSPVPEPPPKIATITRKARA